MRRWAESHTRQRWTKSRKAGSSLLMSLAMVVAPVARDERGQGGGGRGRGWQIRRWETKKGEGAAMGTLVSPT